MKKVFKIVMKIFLGLLITAAILFAGIFYYCTMMAGCE